VTRDLSTMALLQTDNRHPAQVLRHARIHTQHGVHRSFTPFLREQGIAFSHLGVHRTTLSGKAHFFGLTLDLHCSLDFSWPWQRFSLRDASMYCTSQTVLAGCLQRTERERTFFQPATGGT
jgi:hypothetical protein